MSKTIAGNIVDVNAFVASPEKYMLGMFTSLLSGASTVALATVFGLPVSTTHAIIGAIAGFALVEHGSAVHWYPDMLQIIVSWGELDFSCCPLVLHRRNNMVRFVFPVRFVFLLLLFFSFFAGAGRRCFGQHVLCHPAVSAAGARSCAGA